MANREGQGVRFLSLILGYSSSKLPRWGFEDCPTVPLNLSSESPLGARYSGEQLGVVY